MINCENSVLILEVMEVLISAEQRVMKEKQGGLKMRAAVGNALNISWNINVMEVTTSRADIVNTSLILTPSHTLHSTKSPPDCEDQSSGATRNARTDIWFSHCITEPKRLVIKPIIALLRHVPGRIASTPWRSLTMR